MLRCCTPYHRYHHRVVQRIYFGFHWDNEVLVPDNRSHRRDILQCCRPQIVEDYSLIQGINAYLIADPICEILGAIARESAVGKWLQFRGTIASIEVASSQIAVQITLTIARSQITTIANTDFAFQSKENTILNFSRVIYFKPFFFIELGNVDLLLAKSSSGAFDALTFVSVLFLLTDSTIFAFAENVSSFGTVQYFPIQSNLCHALSDFE